MINTILLIVALQIIVITLTGCTMIEEKMQHLQCHAPVDSSLCVGWKV
jgi:hypothetical protein